MCAKKMLPSSMLPSSFLPSKCLLLIFWIIYPNVVELITLRYQQLRMFILVNALLLIRYRFYSNK